ncbi:2-dehydropantoate 2-reductase [Alishewanella longhuensis]|uniref:2-dehydropantoate 2-reductase n=1 Tax=Alishewanella longhuensis TaxID=1091037 RepID=A0ABQ3KVU0_9ALTE|nr:2-dehydropantoate 2-reductase [Alishewanella longhuensis]GHG63957.1 2-dehydropantoate 2-reductase [Alishewanella longhuensis]
MPSTQQKLSWVIVGQGAIGLLTACRLQHASYPVALWLRQPAPLSVTLQASEISTPCYFLPAARPLHQVFIAVKAYAVADCLAQLSPELSANAQLVISHNGMPDLAYLQSVAAFEQGIWFLSTSHAALRTAESVVHTGQGQSILSPLNNAARQAEPAIVAAMTEALGPIQLTTDIRPALWRKLAVNAVINPLTALHNCRNGELATIAFNQQIDRLIAEVCQLAALEHIELERQQTKAHVYQVMHATAKNYSSMQQDRYYQRPLELDAITGFIINTAAKHQLPVPENQALLDALRQTTTL